jgi:membrane-associated PAP2 superfamily phosphatase
MTTKNINLQIIITSIILICVIALFQFSEIDIFIQSHFFNFETKKWLIDKNEPILKFFFYNGVKNSLLIFAIIILLSLIFFRKNSLIKEYKKGLIIVLLAAAIIPSVVGTLKAVTNTPCPNNINYFGGEYPDIKLFDSYPKDFVQKSKIKCWPAGHASGGFALLGLFFLFKTEKNRKKTIVFALIIGWSMGLYKMLLGDHFLSHTIITMVLSWLIILLIVKLTEKFERYNFEKSTKIQLL